jgi:hypothetical protein
MIQFYLGVELFLVNVRGEDCPDANASFFVNETRKMTATSTAASSPAMCRVLPRTVTPKFLRRAAL